MHLMLQITTKYAATSNNEVVNVNSVNVGSTPLINCRKLLNQMEEYYKLRYTFCKHY